ncbi:hypothetical protein HPB50_004912 [Hyalomma asiaticum]|uniref:Uncharacterized protein n=1 Tax=Hyalomma asiaticum TaxID=266040 RepID=A0ACB7S0S3_HYAAI|nr:hypothetical protein HPB50_004912 [Hyalomma asiaticum]
MVPILDCILLGGLVMGNFLLGMYFSLRKKSLRIESAYVKLEMFLGSRALKILPLAASSAASLVSSTGLVGFTAHYYAFGWHLIWIYLGPFLCLPMVTRVFIPVLYRLRITSVFEYIRLRFNAAISLTTCAIYIFLTQSIGAIAISAASLTLFTAVVVKVILDSRSPTSQATTLSDIDLRKYLFETAVTSAFLLLLVYVMPFFMTLALTVWFRGCDPTLLGEIKTVDQGAGLATLITVVYQLSHTGNSIVRGKRPPRMPASLDHCPRNLSLTAAYLNDTLHRSETVSSNESFFLYRLSFLWSSFFSILATVLLGVVISLLTGETHEEEQPELCSDALVRIWRGKRTSRNEAQQEMAHTRPIHCDKQNGKDGKGILFARIPETDV